MHTIAAKQQDLPVLAAGSPTTDIAATGLRSLRILMVACIAVAVLLFAAFAAWRHQQMHAEAEIRLERSLRIAHEHALRVLDTNETLLRHVLASIEGEDDAALLSQQATLHRQLADLTANRPQIQSIWIQGADGRPLATSRFAQPPRDQSVAHREYFKWHQAKRGGVYASSVMTGKTTGERFFNISRGRYRGNGDFAGLVSVGLKADYFTRFHAELAADEPGLAITLFRNDGVVYSRWPELANAPERMSPTFEVLSRVLQGETAGTVRSVSSLDGQQRLILFRKLGDYPVYLGTGRELASVRTAWLRELGTLAAFGVLPILGIVYAAYLALRRTREALEWARKLHDESAARRQVEEALLQAQKMEALGRLTGGVAHDFNNALMVISGNLHLLRLTQPQAPAKYGDAIARAVESATKLTRQLLAFSRRQALAPETLSLQERLPALRDLLQPSLGSKIALEIEVDPAAPAIHVDPAELELALINLAVNARDAMPDGGTFRLAAGRDAQGGAWIQAQDTGEGMPAETAAKAFDPFFTTKPLGKGTGLGLSQVQALCKRAGGDVALTSAPGRGTTIRMQFPAAAGPLRDAGPVASRELSFSKTVVLVEDNPEVAAVVVPVLEKLGCTVVHRESAEAALAWLRTDAHRADVLLTDVVMPGSLDGTELARRVRAGYPHLKVMLMTGYAEQIEAISDLGFEVVPKPFSPRSLAEALERVLAPEQD
jgi:signal transduction histidine kinase